MGMAGTTDGIDWDRLTDAQHDYINQEVTWRAKDCQSSIHKAYQAADGTRRCIVCPTLWMMYPQGMTKDMLKNALPKRRKVSDFQA